MEDSRQMIPAGAPGATALETWLSLYGIRPNTIRYTGTFSDDDGGHDGNAFHSFGFRLLPMGNLHLDAPDHGFRHTVWIIRHQ